MVLVGIDLFFSYILFIELGCCVLIDEVLCIIVGCLGILVEFLCIGSYNFVMV